MRVYTTLIHADVHNHQPVLFAEWTGTKLLDTRNYVAESDGERAVLDGDTYDLPPHSFLRVQSNLLLPSDSILVTDPELAKCGLVVQQADYMGFSALNPFYMSIINPGSASVKLHFSDPVARALVIETY